MSSPPFIAAPFTPVPTPLVDRANRLMSVRANPGFLDVLSLSQELVQETIDATTTYPGWDPQVIVVLKVRQQIAQEHHDRLIGKINEAIQAGIDAMRVQLDSLPAKSAEEAVDHGDFVRQKVLENFEAMDGRIPGSY
jgi:hypothetical protein